MRGDRLLVAALLVLWTVALWTVVPGVGAALEVPYLGARVNDEASLLSGAAKQQIEAELANLERETGAQVAVLTIPTLDGEVLEDYSLRVVETWKLGRAGKDDGVLVLVVRDDRKMRIEVGYGLEAVIPDVLARRVLDERMRPRFRDGDFDGGVRDATSTLAALVRGEENALPPPSEVSGTSRDDFVFFLFFVLIMILLSIANWRSKSRGGGSIWTVGSGGGGGGGGGFSGFSGGGGSFGGGGGSSSW